MAAVTRTTVIGLLPPFWRSANDSFLIGSTGGFDPDLTFIRCPQSGLSALRLHWIRRLRSALLSKSKSVHAATKFPILNTQIRSALPTDALCLSALATQVFFDTCATSGINADLANEAQKLCSQAAFSARLGNPNVEISVAEADGNLVGFVDLQLHSPCPVPSVAGPEVLRLYVQAPFQRLGIGRALLAHAEARASYLGEPSVWLTAWVGNAQALAFYPLVGYAEVGTTQYVIHRLAYENRIFAKALRMVGV